MSPSMNTDLKPRKAARALVLCRVATGLVAVISLLASPMWILCIEEDGSVAIESAWATCCADGESDGHSAPDTSTQPPSVNSAQNGDWCIDVFLDFPADFASHGDAQSPAWPNSTDIDRNCQDNESDRIAGFEPSRHRSTIGHSGSVLVALRTVRLLT
jgi:hypothetical protein